MGHATSASIAKGQQITKRMTQAKKLSMAYYDLWHATAAIVI
jgi:hypothetical protein